MDFVEHVKNTCKTFNVQCKLKNTKYLKLDAKNRCSGYFDESVPVLACAMNRPDSFEILVHEFAHFTQWAEQCTAWTNAMNGGAYIKFNDMLDGKKVRNLSHYLGLCRDLELDNEIRSVSLINKFKLPIDKNQYIKKANSYIYFYNWMMISKRWCKSNNSPYNNKRLMEVMPSHFKNDYTVLPGHIEQIFKEEKI